MTHVWVFIDQNGDCQPGFERLTRARALGDIVAILLGPGGDEAVRALGDYGAAEVWQADTGKRMPAAPLAAALAKQAQHHPPDLILFGQSSTDRDVAGRLSARLGAAILANAQDVQLTDGVVQTTHEVAGGARIATVRTASAPVIVLLRPATVTAQPTGAAARGAAALATLDLPDTGRSEALVVDSHVEQRHDLPLDGADVIVAGGLGMGSQSGFGLIEQLGKLLGAATGASRAIVDAGWVPYAKQVGQTGQTVKPNVYIACGISGAIQHLTGMKSSKTIIAVNTDPEAPIFAVTDLGIVGDVRKVLPKLIEALESRRG